MPGDEIALGRILFNLVENAILHSPANHEVSIQLSSTASHWIIAVQDHGIGIGAEHLPKLFDRFYRVDAARRRSDGGAGLGLAIVKTLTEAHQGNVEVRSEVGVGTTFTLRFPRP
jgi:signal transduction histidine kinase